ncbi:MAG: hypothetical protein Q4F83_00135 [Eubacteriales bacterium]|nr:hypothetical protein [Eubacteriales bacterium]
MKFFERNRKKIWAPICFNIVILICLLLIFSPVFETNDDLELCNIVNGMKGVYDAHMVYSNYVLGLILSMFYRIKQSIPWYTLFQYGVLFVSFTAITHVLWEESKGTCFALFSSAGIFYFSYEGYVLLQYTKTAGIAAAAGILLIFHALRDENIEKLSVILGIVLAGTGFMYRSQQFMAELFLMTGIGVCEVLRMRHLERHEYLSKMLTYVKAFGALLFMVVVLYGVDYCAYQSEEWQEYLEYNRVRTTLFDYGFPQYEEYAEQYQELDLDQNAYELMRSWNHMDPEKFGIPVMEKLIALKGRPCIDTAFFEGFAEDVLKKFPGVAACVCSIVMFLYWMFFGKHDISDVLGMLYELAVVTALYIYLYYQGRYLVNRVDVGIWLAVFVTAAWSFVPGANCMEKTGIPIGAAVAICLICRTGGEYLRSDSEAAREQMVQERAALERIGGDKEHLHITTIGALSFSRCYGVFDTPPFGIGENIAYFGGWSAHMPIYLDTLKRFGISNPYKDVLGNEKVWLIGNEYFGSTMAYIQTYYDADVQAEPVAQYGYFTAYQLE